ncbi:GNAT family N-acetyltransferase [Georgenia sp. TF02-10]|uniref:GNAT family N-acetyltransferase n=1 Tax=Georgenia sp. TF02-10 TaxID=2917725 RepID=UPI001FA7B68A|nr:GNAT family N-acetyltransferase [Georgenia sp. TF02-10]UNX55989.1 GNAT family N-acetyltransferase [Georgenia sp. TF02-10]
MSRAVPAHGVDDGAARALADDGATRALADDGARSHGADDGAAATAVGDRTGEVLDGGGPGGVDVVRVTSRAQLEQCWEVRTEVFVVEQHVPLAEEIDDLDTAATTTHVLAVERTTGRALGTGRLLSDPAHAGEVHLGRLAVRAAARRTGLGARLVVAIEALALAGHAEPAGAALEVTVVLSAQESAMGFYRRLGYEVVDGERYLDAGIWHQDMRRRVRA